MESYLAGHRCTRVLPVDCLATGLTKNCAAASGQSHGRSPKKGVPDLVFRSTGRAPPRTSQREISCGFWPYAFIRIAHWSCTHSSGLRAIAGYSGNNRSRRDLRSGVGGRTPNTTNLTYPLELPPLVRLLVAGVLLDTADLETTVRTHRWNQMCMRQAEAHDRLLRRHCRGSGWCHGRQSGDVTVLLAMAFAQILTVSINRNTLITDFRSRRIRCLAVSLRIHSYTGLAKRYPEWSFFLERTRYPSTYNSTRHTRLFAVEPSSNPSSGKRIAIARTRRDAERSKEP